MHRRKETFVITEDEFRFSLEPYKDHFFIHQEMYRWCPEARRKTTLILDEMLGDWDLRVFVDPTNLKLIKYSAIYGFHYSYTDISPHDGKIYYILRRHDGKVI